MPVVYVSRIEHFSAAHRLHSKELSDEENQRIYGKCNHIHGHGHNYTVEIIVKGEVDPLTGMVVNLTDLKKLIAEYIIEPLDHRHLDKDIEYFWDKPSTTENLAIYFWKILYAELEPYAELYEIRIHETDRNIVSYKGE